MSFMDFMFGKGSEERTKPIYNPGQEDILNQILGGLSGPMSSGMGNLGNILGGDQASFDAFSAPARRDFNQQTLPGIAERFTGSFGEGSQNSSAFGQALGSAGKDLEEDLFSKRMGMQSGALNQLMQLMQSSMSPRQHQYTTDRQPGFLENVGVPIAQGIGGGIPGFIAKLFGG